MPYCFEYTHRKTSPRNMLHRSQTTQSSHPSPIYNVKPTVSTKLIDTQCSQTFLQSTSSITHINLFRTPFWTLFRPDICVCLFETKIWKSSGRRDLWVLRGVPKKCFGFTAHCSGLGGYWICLSLDDFHVLNLYVSIFFSGRTFWMSFFL